MAMLKDSIITGDLRVTGTIYGDVPLSDLVNADDLKAIEALSGNSGILKKTGVNTWILDTNAYTTTSGTVTSVRVQATSPVVSSVNTAQSTTLNTTISLASGYGDTQNPYASKTARYVLAAPATANGVPSFRALTNADVGLGNVENKSSATIRGELTSSNVTTALGFTPYNATNPNGYTTNVGTITGVTGSDGLTGSGTSGSVTIKHAAPSTSPAKTTSAVYPITIDKYGHITAAGSAVTIPAAVSVKGNAETTYRTGQVNLTPANIGAAAASHTHPIKTITGTMPTSTSSPWTINATNKTVQISDSKITAKSVLQWGLASTATQAQYEAFAEAQFIDSTTAAGSATIKALGTMPTVAIPVVIHILGETE